MVKCTQKNSHLHSFTWLPVPHLKITYLLKHNPEKYFHNRFEFSSMPCDYCTKPSVTAPDSNKNSNMHTTSLDLWIANRLTRTVHKDTCKGADKFSGSKITIIVKKLPTKCSPEVNWHQCHWMDKAALRNQDLGYNRLPSTHYFTCNLHRNKPEVQWKLSFHRTISKSQSWT